MDSFLTDTKSKAGIPVASVLTRIGTVVAADDVAFVTEVCSRFCTVDFPAPRNRFQPYFTTSNKIEFAPWRSAERRKYTRS